MGNTGKKRIIVGISGASGAILGIETLRGLRKSGQFETHLVLTRGGERTITEETAYSLPEVCGLADVCHSVRDIGASIASGSFRTHGMVIVPCTMKTLAGIACGYSDNLLLRAADVVLKERRKLVLVPRETPLSLIHLHNMAALSQMGAVVLPPMLSFYHRPQSVEELVQHFVGKILDQFDVEYAGFRRWKGDTV